MLTHAFLTNAPEHYLLRLQFPYVDAVLKEALRMEPPAGFGTLRELREVGSWRHLQGIQRLNYGGCQTPDGCFTGYQ